MKGIYLTQEGKQEIEAKIVELKEENKFPIDKWEEGKNQGKIYILEQILSSATILPVESVDIVFRTADDDVNHYIENIACLPSKYPNGVIIQPKQ
jgi:hypothetical protein